MILAHMHPKHVFHTFISIFIHTHTSESEILISEYDPREEITAVTIIPFKKISMREI